MADADFAELPSANFKITCHWCERVARWNVWPDASQTGYDFLCDSHLHEAIRLGVKVAHPSGAGWVRTPLAQASLRKER